MDSGRNSTPETHNFCNTIVLPPWILRAILAKEASSVKEIFVATREAAISQDTLLHEEDEMSDKEQPPADKGPTVESTKTFFHHLFVWGQEAAIWKDKGDVNNCAAAPSAIPKLDRWRDEKHWEHLTPQAVPGRAQAPTTTGTLPDSSAQNSQRQLQS